MVRQQALATAQVYIKRFYTKVEIRRTNPYLVVATALYVACKMEECNQHIRAIVTEARSAWPGLLHVLHPIIMLKTFLADFLFSDIAKLGECEFSLISEMNSQLIVHHPYRTLSDLYGKLGMGQDEQSLAWSIINDHYMTDAPLLYPPHLIAVTAIFLAMTLKPTPGGLAAVASAATNLSGSNFLQGELPSGGSNTSSSQQKKVENLVKWLAEGEIDIRSVIECSQEIISLYDVLDQYNEKLCKEQIARFVKARGLDK